MEVPASAEGPRSHSQLLKSGPASARHPQGRDGIFQSRRGGSASLKTAASRGRQTSHDRGACTKDAAVPRNSSVIFIWCSPLNLILIFVESSNDRGLTHAKSLLLETCSLGSSSSGVQTRATHFTPHGRSENVCVGKTRMCVSEKRVAQE